MIKTLSAGTAVDLGIEHLLSADPSEPSQPGLFDSHELVSIQPVAGKHGLYHDVKVRDYSRPFKHNWARLGPFVTGMGRKRMFDAFEQHEPHIRWAHTDGVVLDKAIDLKDPAEMNVRMARHLKCVAGTFNIVNCNRKTCTTNT